MSLDATAISLFTLLNNERNCVLTEGNRNDFQGDSEGCDSSEGKSRTDGGDIHLKRDGMAIWGWATQLFNPGSFFVVDFARSPWS